jgi:hypothetical protein
MSESEYCECDKSEWTLTDFHYAIHTKPSCRKWIRLRDVLEGWEKYRKQGWNA